MERIELYNEMLKVAEEIQNKKEEKLAEEELKNSKWAMINPIILQIIQDVYTDTEVKRTEDAKEKEINFRKFNNPAIQSTLLEIDKLNLSIKKLEIEIEFKENELKCYKYAYGGCLL